VKSCYAVPVIICPSLTPQMLEDPLVRAYHYHGDFLNYLYFSNREEYKQWSDYYRVSLHSESDPPYPTEYRDSPT